MVMRPQSAKAKGRRLQQFIAQELLRIFPHLSEDDIRSTSMGAGGEDIQLSSAARRCIPFSIEAKNQERLNVWAALDQAKANAPTNCEPIVVLKKNSCKPHVLLSWDCFARMLSNVDEGGKMMSEKELFLHMADKLQMLASSMQD